MGADLRVTEGNMRCSRRPADSRAAGPGLGAEGGSPAPAAGRPPSLWPRHPGCGNWSPRSSSVGLPGTELHQIYGGPTEKGGER